MPKPSTQARVVNQTEEKPKAGSGRLFRRLLSVDVAAQARLTSFEFP